MDAFAELKHAMDPRHHDDFEWDLGAWGDGEGCSAIRRTAGRYFCLDPSTEKWQPLSKSAAVELLEYAGYFV